MARGPGQPAGSVLGRHPQLAARGALGELPLTRDLADVADYFLPRAVAAAAPVRPVPAEAEPDRRRALAPERPAALPILAIPIGERDVVRAAFAWNLVVEAARLGASATLLAPRDAEPSPVWPEPGAGPLGAQVVLESIQGLAELNRAALDVAVSRAADAADGGVVVVRVPPAWLEAPRDARALLRWVLLLASTERRDLLDAYALAKRVLGSRDGACVGITIHGTRRISDAERAFQHVAGVCQRHLGAPLVSYGLLVDDLHLYRAIVSRRPIGLEHPQSRAARALRDVARLVLEDAGNLARA